MYKYKDTGFRALYHNFCVFPITETIKKVIDIIPYSKDADCVLTYGYIDIEAGMTLDILALSKKTDDGFSFLDITDEYRLLLRIGSVEDDEFYYLSDEDGELKNEYAERLKVIESYDANEQVEESRKMDFLDGCRHPHYPDDIQVVILKECHHPEACWVRITGLGDKCIIGKLLNEPHQNLGCHEGSEIKFNIDKKDDDSIVCYADITADYPISDEDFEDGTILKSAISEFNKDRTKENLLFVMSILRDSYVWIPCNAITGEADYENIARKVLDAKDNLDELVGMEFSTTEDIRMIPDILQNGDNFFFPIFTTVDDMGEYGKNFSKVQKHFFEALVLAKNNDKNVSGIVVNAFSEPFVLDRDLFDVVTKMDSRLPKEE